MQEQGSLEGFVVTQAVVVVDAAVRCDSGWNRYKNRFEYWIHPGRSWDSLVGLETGTDPS